MGRQNKLMRNLLGILKDKASLIKATLSIKPITVAVLRATTHSPSSPPPDHRIAALLSLGNDTRPTACATVAAVMDRLHSTPDTFVALKCLITLHHIISQGSFILKDQLSFYPSSGGRNFLNLSVFRDGRDAETWELSNWVRWYAGVLERNLITSRVLGVYISDPSSTKVTVTTTLLNSDLIRDVDVLVGLVEEICRAPDSLHFQQYDLVYEVVNLVGEDYRSTQQQIVIRLGECGERIGGLSSGELVELTRCLKRLEECRERLVVVFVNRKRNDAFWDLVGETKVKAERVVEEERERERWLVRLGGPRREEGSESTRGGERVLRPSQLLMLPYGGEWLGLDRVQRTVPSAMA
ncbi:hypothetical protein CsSME_00035502 [Camellia sinensis var. sinensis]